MSGYRKKKKFYKKCGFKKWNMVKYVERKVDTDGFHMYGYLIAEYQVLVMTLDTAKTAPFLTPLPSDFNGDCISEYEIDNGRLALVRDPIISRFIEHNGKFKKYVNATIYNPSALHVSGVSNYVKDLVPNSNNDWNSTIG